VKIDSGVRVVVKNGLKTCRFVMICFNLWSICVKNEKKGVFGVAENGCFYDYARI
jgi:hypothetical protein